MSQLILQVNEFFLGLQLVFVKKALIGIQASTITNEDWTDIIDL